MKYQCMLDNLYEENNDSKINIALHSATLYWDLYLTFICMIYLYIERN